MKRRERVPNVLWTLFKNKARTLSTTIISLIPLNCDCNAKGKCLRCVFGNGDEAAMSYLVRPDDPIDFRRFMKSCFLVIPGDAPPFPPLVSFTHFWSQLQVGSISRFRVCLDTNFGEKGRGGRWKGREGKIDIFLPNLAKVGKTLIGIGGTTMDPSNFLSSISPNSIGYPNKGN